MEVVEYPKDECYTPQWVFDGLGIKFDLDVASANHPLIVVPTKNRYTKDDDALLQDWFGNVWMNPPFSKVTPWIDKWLNHNQGICLVPLSSNARWINKLWDSEAACLYLPPNMKFQGASGLTVHMRWRTALWALGDQNIEALERLNIGKVRL